MSFFLKNFYYLESMSKLIIFLSFLGLLPFIFGTIDLWLNKENLYFGKNIPKLYGSIILTFLGSVYWGIMLKEDNENLFSQKTKIFVILWSIIPSIWGVLLLILSNKLSISILALCFIIVQIIDEYLIKLFKFPNWYLYLRRTLTILVVTILIISYFLIINV